LRGRVAGTPVNHFQLSGADHPEQTVWRESHTKITLRTDTNSDGDIVNMMTGVLQHTTLHLQQDINSHIKLAVFLIS
jgi:hypothetical protein